MNDIFTPIDSTSGERLTIPAEEVTLLGGSLEQRKLGYQATIRWRGAQYNVIGIPCTLEGCNCDAKIVPVANKREHEKYRNMIPLTDAAVEEYAEKIADAMQPERRLSVEDKADIELWAKRIAYTANRRIVRADNERLAQITGDR